MDDVVINCKDKSIPLKVILKSKGSVIVDQTMKKVFRTVFILNAVNELIILAFCVFS
jgi:hypothetical protein